MAELTLGVEANETGLPDFADCTIKELYYCAMTAPRAETCAKASLTGSRDELPA